MLQNYNYLGVLSSILPFFLKNYQIWRCLVTIQPFTPRKGAKTLSSYFIVAFILLAGACAHN